MRRFEEKGIGGHEVRREPVSGKENKFVITEDEAWFLPFEDNAIAPRLGEMLAAILEVDLSDEGVAQQVDAKLGDGRVLLGYVTRDGLGISVHSLPDPTDKSVLKRLVAVFGKDLRLLQSVQDDETRG